jgi:hypothetical protein
VSYDAEGCSISQASASVMTDLVIGRSVPEAMQRHQEFVDLMQSRGTVEPDEDVLEDGIAFAGVAKFPGACEVRAAGVDGMEGRRRASVGPRGVPMTEQTELTAQQTGRAADDLPEVDLSDGSRPRASTTSPRPCATWSTPSSASTWSTSAWCTTST